MQEEALQKIQRALSDHLTYGGKYFTGQKKRGNQKSKITDKQRKIDHLTSKQKYQLIQLHKDLDRVMVANSFVSRGGGPNKRTKKDARKGTNSLEVHGIWSSVTFERYTKSCRTFLKFCFENFDNVRSLRDIKPKMVGKFIEHQLAKNNSAKTISFYVSSIKKMAESAVKAGIKSHASLVNDKHRAMVPIAKKSERRRGSVGGVGYTYREARILIKAAEKHFGIYEALLIEVLTYSCPRLKEILKVSYDQIDYENKCIYMNKKNQNKNNRPRMVPLTDSIIEKLKALEPLFPNKQMRIWGSKMSEKKVRGLIRECCRLGHIAYKGCHDLRKAGVEWHLKRMETDPEWTKEKLVNEIMRFVDADPPRLNPIIQRNGILQPKYVPEQLMQRELRWLRNQYLSQLLGHNRNDASCPYKRTKIK